MKWLFMTLNGIFGKNILLNLLKSHFTICISHFLFKSITFQQLNSIYPNFAFLFSSLYVAISTLALFLVFLKQLLLIKKLLEETMIFNCFWSSLFLLVALGLFSIIFLQAEEYLWALLVMQLSCWQIPSAFIYLKMSVFQHLFWGMLSLEIIFWHFHCFL